ncbi:MAG TPA: azurin [Flavobacterium sp.]|nr:azurin [Flavobacterium sp.]
MKKTIKTIALLSLTSLIIACKGDTKKAEDTTTTSPTTETTAPESTAFAVTIEGNDQMQFNKKEVKVPVGEPIELTLKHVGKMAKEVMGHNFVLLDKGVDFNGFATKASVAKDTDYIPEDTSGVIVHTAMLGGGESETVEFTIHEAGSYEFLCTFPGHYAMMKGVLIAE